MLDIVYGQTKKRSIANQLIEALGRLNLTGTLYIGYPVTASVDEAVAVDALLCSKEHGLVVFLFADNPPDRSNSEAWKALKDSQDNVYVVIKNNLIKHADLRRGRDLGFELQTLTLFPSEPHCPDEPDQGFVALAGVEEAVHSFADLPVVFERPLNAALQRVSTIKPVKKRTNVSRPGSKGDVLKRIEREIANLDKWQSQAAYESPEGPQRVRGLAGSGKTVVLALKAAYFHTQHPEWDIAVTFFSRALYQQFKDLIQRFVYWHSSDAPNWDKLRILHSWGGVNQPGFYTEIAEKCNATARDYRYGSSLFGRDQAFFGVCDELLKITDSSDAEPIYDAILIDEAQDLPTPFFRLAYRFTRPPKRIVWAYDELQNLTDKGMSSIGELFGVDAQGKPVIKLDADARPRQDLVLPVCYRNTPWALSLAHALGFGLYRTGGLIQHFDEPGLWEDIGYQCVEGKLQAGQQVTLERRRDSYPEYFDDLLKPDDAVQYQVFSDNIAQAECVATNIEDNLKNDELEADDILIVLPNALTSKTQAHIIQQALARKGINAHLVGVTSSQDEVFQPRSIAITHIFRAKGNEAPMVYVLNSQHCVANSSLISLRNTLFTAVTRSRAWVRIYGWGPNMQLLAKEIDRIKGEDSRYQLRFRIPTPHELEKLRRVHRDQSAQERAKAKKGEKGLQDFLEAYKEGALDLEHLPLELRTALAQLMKKEDADAEQLED